MKNCQFVRKVDSNLAPPKWSPSWIQCPIPLCAANSSLSALPSTIFLLPVSVVVKPHKNNSCGRRNPENPEQTEASSFQQSCLSVLKNRLFLALLSHLLCVCEDIYLTPFTCMSALKLMANLHCRSLSTITNKYLLLIF